jgi:hypothetical protein
MTHDIAAVRLSAGLADFFGDDAEDRTFKADFRGENFNALGISAVGLLLFFSR